MLILSFFKTSWCISQDIEERLAKAIQANPSSAMLYYLVAQHTRIYRRNEHIERLHLCFTEVSGSNFFHVGVSWF